MSRLLAAAVLLSLAAPSSAHRLDEYLQATLISVERDRVQASLRLVPGVAVSSFVIASIDSNGDGVISDAEQRAYAERVLGDLALNVDGQPLKPRLTSVRFPGIGEMQEGVGEIQIEFSAGLPRGGSHRRLIFENRHQRRIAAYLVNCLVPRDKAIQITSQNRNETQSLYQLDYVQAGGLSGSGASRGAIGLLLFAGLVLFWRLSARTAGMRNAGSEAAEASNSKLLNDGRD